MKAKYTAIYVGEGLCALPSAGTEAGPNKRVWH